MDRKRFAAWGQGQPGENESQEIPVAERCVTLLLEAAMLKAPEIDAASYREFRTSLNRLALQLPDPGTPDDKLTLLRMMAHEFENYYSESAKALRERVTAWRSLTARMARELVTLLGVPVTEPNVALLLKQAADLTTVEEIQGFRGLLESLLRPTTTPATAEVAALEKSADRSTSNDNAVGLPGSGAAVKRIEEIIARGGRGFIVLFRLSCLEVIRQRFGPDAMQDAVMAVSSFLTSSLHGDDAIFHWSDAALLAVLQGRASEQILAAELQRLVMANRDTNVNIGGRNIMVRIPISFDMTSIERLRSAEDLFQLSWLRPSTSKW
jgi:GGDEF domain-containing protein